MKKMLPLLLMLFFVLPLTNAFALTNNANADQTYYIKLSRSVNITSAKMMGNYSPVITKFYDSEKKMLRTSNLNDYKYDFSTAIGGARYISVIIPSKQRMDSVVLYIDGSNYGSEYSNFELVPEGFFDTPIERKPISNLTSVSRFDSIDIAWINPDSSDIETIIVKSNGVEVASLLNTIKKYTLNNLTPETTYNIEVIVKYSDGEFSESKSIKVTTDKAPPEPEPPGDIEELKVDVDYDRVDLSWELPKSDNFKHVNIYRDTLEKSFFDKLLGVNSVKAATPIFETNGTYFNDLTVQPETKYEYLITTLSTEGLESNGVSKIVMTPKEPDPEIEGGGHEKDPSTGDFTYTWSKPTEGEVKVIVGGKLYKTVPASDGKIVIPAADMKYTFLGKPDVQLVPVSPSGNEGKPVSPPSGGSNGGGNGGGSSGAEMPFKANDLVMTTFQIIGLLSGILLIVLAIQLAPRIIAVIKQSIKNRGMVK